MRLEDVFATVFDHPADTFDDSYSQATQAEWTSMRHISLLVEIERAFDIRFSNAEMASMRSISDIRAALQTKDAAVG